MAENPWQLKTQMADYWQEGFAAVPEDLEGLYMFVLEKGLPQDIRALTLQAMKRRCEAEKRAVEGELAAHPFFQPQGAYQAGQKLTFSSEGYAIGTVLSVRPGVNPSYGSFTVLEVEFEGKASKKYFAADLGDRAPAGFPQPPKPDGLLSPQALYEFYGAKWVLPRLRETLEKNQDFVYLGDRWFLQELVAEIHVGHINICEALVDVAGRALTAEEMLGELELPEAIAREVQLFSLNYALSRSEIFVNLGEVGEAKWYLTRLGPPKSKR